jgi:two-component sensor histidine kinase
MDRTILPQTGEYLTDGARLIEGLDAGRVGVWRWTVNTNNLDWSPNLEKVHGLPEGSFDGTIDSFQQDIDPADAGKVWDAIQRSVETGEPYSVTYRTRGAANSPPLWIEATGEIVEALDGTRYLTGTCADVTERVLAQRELELRLNQQNAVAEFGVYAFGQIRLEPVLQRACEIAAEVLGAPLTKILRFAGSADHLVLAAGVGWKDGLVGLGTVPVGLDSQAGYTLMTRGPVIVADLLTETRFSGPKLLRDYNVRSGMSVVIAGSTSRPFGVFGVHSTELRTFTVTDAEFLSSLANIVANSARHVDAADQSQLLVREMTHRAGNMMQLVSTLASQTFAHAPDTDTALRAFSERLGALSRANYLVAAGGWRSTRFANLLAEILQPFEDRLTLSGLDVLLPPELCFDLGLVIHELASNSIRHGSLGKGGTTRAELSWSVEVLESGRNVLVLLWRDPVNREANPTAPRQGFGTRLLDGLIVRKWEGSITIDRQNGFAMTARIPFDPV